MYTETSTLIPAEASIVTGAIAFILTSTHVVMSFLVFFKMIPGLTLPAKWFMVFFFITGIAMSVTWLLYLWPYNSLFLRIALGLQVLSSMIFLVQTLMLPAKHTSEITF
jgi:hypothetical protein